MISKEEIFQKVESVFMESFELKKEQIALEANLYEDLDFDSMDAIEMVLILEEEYDEKISAEQLREAKTVQDVIDILYDLFQAPNSSETETSNTSNMVSETK